MKEYPILFLAEMVQATLEGRKTQTRRIIKPQPISELDPWVYDLDGKKRQHWCGQSEKERGTERSVSWRCPYGQSGDRNWVRETWHSEDIGGGIPLFKITYCADGFTDIKTPALAGLPRDGKHPSIYMPRALSRIVQDVLSVRVERLQDITPDDCLLEGVVKRKSYSWECYALDDYQNLWDSINQKRGFGWITKGNISISFIHNPGGEPYVAITVIDDMSRTRFLEVEMSALDFAKTAMGSQGYVDCTFELYPARVGL